MASTYPIDTQFWMLVGRVDSRYAPAEPAPSRAQFTKTYLFVTEPERVPEDLFETDEWALYSDGWLTKKAEMMRLGQDG